MHAARPPTVRTARGASHKPITHEREPTLPRARVPTCMEAGDRRPCSAATIGPRPIATRIDRPGTRRARSEPMKDQPSRGVVREAQPSASATAATSTPATTGTSTGARTGRGRSTTTAAGRIPTGSLVVRGQPRRTGRRRASSRPIEQVDRSTTDQLNRDAAARREGTQRSNDYGNYKGSSGTRSTGSYRSGGGASRGRRRFARRRREALTSVKQRVDLRNEERRRECAAR